jgi:hypothetical protein
MDQFIRRLGKPRSWWLTMFAALAALVLGSASVGLYFLGVPVAARIGYYIIIVCWLVGVTSMFVYVRGQFRGRYRALHGKPWSQLPW